MSKKGISVFFKSWVTLVHWANDKVCMYSRMDVRFCCTVLIKDLSRYVRNQKMIQSGSLIRLTMWPKHFGARPGDNLDRVPWAHRKSTPPGGTRSRWSRRGQSTCRDGSSEGRTAQRREAGKHAGQSPSWLCLRFSSVSFLGLPSFMSVWQQIAFRFPLRFLSCLRCFPLFYVCLLFGTALRDVPRSITLCICTQSQLNNPCQPFIFKGPFCQLSASLHVPTGKATTAHGDAHFGALTVSPYCMPSPYPASTKEVLMLGAVCTSIKRFLFKPLLLVL